MKREYRVYYGRVVKFSKDIVDRSIEDNITGIGAQMSFYFILSFFPFLIFLIALLAYTNISSEVILSNLSNYLPSDVFKIVKDFMYNSLNSATTTILSFGALTTIWVASNGIESLILGINNAYDLDEKRSYWKIKFLSIVFTFILAFIYVFSLIMVVFGSLIAKKTLILIGFSNVFIYFWNVTRYVIPILTIFTFLLIIYNFLPSRRIGLKKIIPGAIFGTFAWIIISQVFSYYINNFGTLAQLYGSLGGIIVLLLWLYWCGIAIMVGAEINSTLYYFRAPKKKLLIK